MRSSSCVTWFGVAGVVPGGPRLMPQTVDKSARGWIHCNAIGKFVDSSGISLYNSGVVAICGGRLKSGSAWWRREPGHRAHLVAQIGTHPQLPPESFPTMFDEQSGSPIAEEWRRDATESRTAEASTKSCHVLLVEDDAAVAELYATVLRRYGHVVTVAVDGLAGLEAIKSGSFDLILLDIRMPRMDGLAMLRTMIGEEVATDTPVVMLTNYDDSILRQEALDLGAREYLLKSRTMPQDLASQLTRWCG